jgi:hypothetical protein
MKPVPHNHGCPACECVWNCNNENCTDLEGKYCDNFCKLCPDPPEYLKHLMQAENAGHEIDHAAYVLDHYAEEHELAVQARELRDRIRAAVQVKGKGVHRKRRLGEAEVPGAAEEPS